MHESVKPQGLPLLANDEPPACELVHPAGASPYFLTCDHAGHRVPRRLQQLGLDEQELQRHIGWDIGAAGLSRELAMLLDATLVLQPYSRLVIDCNRPPQAPDSIARLSEATTIPGNQSVTPAEVAQRQAAIFDPYHACIRAQLAARRQRGQPTLLLAMHSFTPVYLGQARPWHVGVLYHRDPRMAHALRDLLGQDAGLCVGDNQPYTVCDDSDYGIPEYGERGGLPHVELEIRQDLIADAAGQRRWALRLARCLRMLEQQLLQL
ncbi:MAG TPA: N-formylglutamate amidohydrolase [Solimonas sp.]|nr:N-formylglutamate amidohydrolase [Solimonas sp.]